MKLIEEITQPTWRDKRYRAIFECEHCGDRHEGGAHDSVEFWEDVMPYMACPACKRETASTGCYVTGCACMKTGA